MLQCTMPMLPRAMAGRFRAELLFRPASVAVFGGNTEQGRRILANLHQGGFQGSILTDPDVSAAPDLAVVCTDPATLFPELAAAGTRAAIVPVPANGLRALARQTGLRSLGGSSFGVCVPSIGLNATTAHLMPGKGRLALVSQSAALCRAVLDWAEPNGVGFSHIVGVGENDDIGFSVVLDWLSRDPETGAILLDIDHIKDRRLFLSAARAAARMRPVVALHAGGRVQDPSGDADAIFTAALRRCGVLSVASLDDVLAAAETLTRARPARGEGLAIVCNDDGLAQHASGAALRLGLTLDGPARRDLDLSGDPGGFLIVQSPDGHNDAAAIEALITASAGVKPPVLVCAMGETNGAANRRRLAAAGVPEFATPEQAVRGFLHLVQDRRNRIAARELPASNVLSVAPDRAEVRRLFDAAGPVLTAEDSLRVLAAYGVPVGPSQAIGMREVRIRVTDDTVFGPIIAFGHGGAVSDQLHDFAFDLPPLNLPLAHALALGPRVAATFSASHHQPAANLDAIAETLVRISQLIVDNPRIAALDVNPLCVDDAGVVAVDAWIRLRGDCEAPSRLAIPPYPVELTVAFDAGGVPLTIRPIRPEDAAAHAAFFGRLSPEDVRYRFFSALRELSAEQIARMTQIDYEREIAFVAVHATTGETVGVARLVRDGEGPTAEFAVVVQRDMKGRGLARRLMQCLFAWGRAHEAEEIEGQILADNPNMLAFIRRLGFSVRRMPGASDVVLASLRLA